MTGAEIPPGARGDRAGRTSARLLSVLLAFAAVALVACGGESESSSSFPAPISGDDPNLGEEFADANPDDVGVIRGWTDALREGKIDEAAEFFALPSVAENGPVLIRISSRGDARAFNMALPCGAFLIGAETVGDFTVARFELTERPGEGVCGAPEGATASTAFVIRDGKIAEWRRVREGGEPPPGGQSA